MMWAFAGVGLILYDVGLGMFAFTLGRAAKNGDAMMRERK